MTTITQVITALPTAPDPATMTRDEFSTAAAAFVLAQKDDLQPELNTWATQVNTVKGEMVTHEANTTAAAATATTQAGIATAAAATAASAPGTSATSTTSESIGLGSKSLTIQTGKSLVAGMWITAADTSAPSTNWMAGLITSYTSGSGALVFDAKVKDGSGTLTAWTVGLSGPGGATLASNTFTGAQNEAHGADIASASTINLSTATGNLVDVTGTTTITAVTLMEGAERTVRFTGVLTLTNGASLVLPGGANITTAAGDFAKFRGYGSGVVRCVVYSRASGQPVASSSVGDHHVYVTNVNGNGSTNTCIPRWTTTQSSAGTSITYADSAANGSSFTVNDTGLYMVEFSGAGSNLYHGVSVNTSQGATAIQSINASDRVAITQTHSGGLGFGHVTACLYLAANDVVRPHTQGQTDGATIYAWFRIRRIG